MHDFELLDSFEAWITQVHRRCRNAPVRLPPPTATAVGLALALASASGPAESQEITITTDSNEVTRG